MTMHIIANRLGKGKTTLLVWIAMNQYIKGRRIYSNIWLSFPHTRISSVEDLNSIRAVCHCCGEPQSHWEMTCLKCGCDRWDGADVFIDDAYLWFYTPLVGTNPIVTKIMAFSRKRGMDIYYTITRSNTLHVNIRGCTEYIWIPVLWKPLNSIFAAKFEYLGDKEKCGDDERIGQPMGGRVVRNVDYIWKQFNTYEEAQVPEGITYGNQRRKA
jgi:hypothetical protein